MSEWVVLLHVAVAFWFVAGLLGRNVTMAQGEVHDRPVQPRGARSP